ncbi:MAG: SUMF1/EgtB/PvdO family nonheme iron enzyme [Deltaproteobacteria bacterium]|nr:SUMF1/EgtB/PvdO family nonheme iron enzyme [Deltaproteobacteria bacterium]
MCYLSGISQLGSTSTSAPFEERPALGARLRAFALDRDEVTVAQYQECVTRGGCSALVRCDVSDRDAGPPAEWRGDSAVRCVRWDDARAFCASRMGRLPSEAEWERASAGILPMHRRFPWGDALEVGDDAGAPNDRTAEGARSLGGGVSEWTGDYGAFYAPPRPIVRDAGAGDGQSSDASVSDDAAVDQSERETPSVQSSDPTLDAGLPIVDNPHGPSQSPWRVVRGGHDGQVRTRWTSTRRVFRQPDDRLPWLGFRCAYDLPQDAQP